MAIPKSSVAAAPALPHVMRRRIAIAIVIAAIAAIAGLVLLAVVADGREVSHASSNDGGAWLVNQKLGVIGHRNRSVGELSGFRRVSDSPDAEIHQSGDVIVVHDPTTQLLHEVDARTGGQDLEPTMLPASAQVTAVDGFVVIAQPDPLRVWRIGPDELSTIASLDSVAPLLELGGPATIAVTAEGRVAVADETDRELHWLPVSGERPEPIAFTVEGDIADMTIVDDTAVLLATNGDLVVIGDNQVNHQIVWSSAAPQAASEPVVLQQPSALAGSQSRGLAEQVVAVSQDGAVFQVSFAAQPLVVVLAELGGELPLAPIVHNGCVYAVVTDPALLGVVCDELQTRQLEGAGSALRLRLVNGWVWVNDLSDGGTWITTDDGDVEMLNDWSLAERALQDEPQNDDDEASTSSNPASERTLFADADADGPIRNGDDFDPADTNVPPVLAADSARTRLDRVAIVPVLANDFDANNDILVVTSAVLLSGQAQITITPEGNEIQVAPNPGFVGTIEFDYSVSDGYNPVVTARATVDVVPIESSNLPPVAETDVVATSPGHSTTINVLRNDFDPDGDSVALISIESDGGTLRWSPNGQITFTPDTTTESGWVDLEYVVVDDLGAEATGLVRVEIRDRGANQEPDARNDHATTVEGRPVVLNLLANDSDPDGDTLIVGSRPELLSPEGAQVEMSTTADGEFVFSANVAGTYLLSYTVTDSAEGGSELDTARIRIDVLAAIENTPPVAVRDDVVLAAGESQVVYVLENDGDADGDVISIVDWQSTPGLQVAEFSGPGGHVGFRVTAAPGAPPRSRFVYSISDGKSDPVSAAVVVTVVSRLPFNQPPIANNDVVEVRSGSTVAGIDVLANDFDPEGGSLSITAVGEAGGVAGVRIEIAADAQTLQLTVPDAVESSFTFSYDIEDEDGNRAAAVVQVQLVADEAVNRPPTARVDDARTVQGSDVEIDALANDSDPDGDVIVLESIVDQPRNGSATVSSNGKVRYQPDASFTGTDLVRYAIVDSQGDRAVGEIFVGVTAREAFNQPPIANDDSYSLAGSSALTPLDVVANDFDPEGDPLRVIDVTRATLGVVLIDEFGGVQFGPPARLEVPTTITFGYTIADNAGNRDDAIVVIEMPAFESTEPVPTPVPPVVEPTPTPEVTPTPAPTTEPTDPSEPTENQPPVAVDDEVGPVAVGTEVVVDAIANDFDPDGEVGDLRISSVGGGAQRNGEFVVVQVGSETVQLSYTIVDADGAEDSATITVLVNANRPPNTEPLTVEVPFETAIDLDLAAQATDPDGDALFFVCCDNIRGGAITNVEAAEGTLSLRFTPSDGFTGDAAFAYTVDDQQGHQTAGSVRISVGPPDNRPPIALDNTVDVPQGATIPVNLSELSSDPDDDDLSWTIEVEPGLGIESLLSGPVVVLTAGNDRTVGETTSFTYQVSDGPLNATGTVNLIITPGENQPPTANATAIELAAGSGTTVDLRPFVTDPDTGDQLSFSLDESAPVDGVSVQLTGSILQLNAQADAAGATTSVTYTVTDRRGETATAVVSVTVVEPTAPDPRAVDDEANAQAGSTVIIDVLANDIDPLGEGLTVVTATSAQGTARVVDEGVSFTSTTDTGALLVTYTIVDVAGRESSAIIVVETVGPPEQPAPPSLVASSKQVIVSWTSPQERGTPITGYVITSNTGETRTVGLVNSLTWDGLTNGDTYTFTITAQSQSGPSDPSEPSLGATPDERPGRPSPPSVIFGDNELTAVWSEPANEGSTITGYELEIGGSLSDVQGVGTANSFTWTGLSDGEEYTFRVRAENGAGFGVWSAPSPSERPTGVPSAPRSVVAERGGLSGSLTITWSEPLNDNGGDILDYQVLPSIGSPIELGQTVTSYAWSNLRNDEEIQFQVQARNRAGWGPVSALSVPIVPCGTPDRPAIDSATRLDKAADVRIGAPNNNGCEITSYIVTATNVSNGDNLVESLSATSLDFPSLENGTTYTFSVVAVNEIGTSLPSAASNQVTPAGPPICATNTDFSATPTAPGTISLNWEEAIDNGDEITGHIIEVDGVEQTSGAATTAPITGLANNTTYTFSVRAENGAGQSGVCGSVSATTWALPGAVNVVSYVYDQPNDTLMATVDGGASPSNPITSWSADISHDGSQDQSWSGTSNPSSSFSIDVVDEATYTFVFEVCNAVGCVNATDSIDVEPPTKPSQMSAPVLQSELGDFGTFGIDIYAIFSPPADDGGLPVMHYLWEERWVDVSGATRNDNGQIDTTSELFVHNYPGYSSYSEGTNRGQTVTFEVRVRAENDEGRGDWSDWGSVSPTPPAPRFALEVGGYTACQTRFDPAEPDFAICSEVAAIAIGVAPNRAYQFSVSGVSGSSLQDCTGFTFATDATGYWAGDTGCRHIDEYGPGTLTGTITPVAPNPGRPPLTSDPLGFG